MISVVSISVRLDYHSRHQRLPVSLITREWSRLPSSARLYCFPTWPTYISGLVAAEVTPSPFEYCDTHTHLMILFVFHTQQASYLRVWAMGWSKSRPGEEVGLVIVCAIKSKWPIYEPTQQGYLIYKAHPRRSVLIALLASYAFAFTHEWMND